MTGGPPDRGPDLSLLGRTGPKERFGCRGPLFVGEQASASSTTGDRPRPDRRRRTRPETPPTLVGPRRQGRRTRTPDNVSLYGDLYFPLLFHSSWGPGLYVSSLPLPGPPSFSFFPSPLPFPVSESLTLPPPITFSPSLLPRPHPSLPFSPSPPSLSPLPPVPFGTWSRPSLPRPLLRFPQGVGTEKVSRTFTKPVCRRSERVPLPKEQILTQTCGLGRDGVT